MTAVLGPDAPAAGGLGRATAPRWAAPLRAVDSWSATADGSGIALAGRVRIDPADPNLRGHFPGLPVYPGVFVLETLHQLVGLALPDAGGAPPVLREVRSVRFLAPLFGGDELTVTARMRPAEGDGWLLEATGTRGDGAPTCTAALVVEASTGLEPDPPAGPDAPAGPPPDGPPPTGRDRPSGRDHRAIRDLLPQRHPLLLVDRVLDLRPGRSVHAVTTVSGTDPCYAALPPDAPAAALAYPAPLLVEAFGQAAALLWLDGADGVGPDEVLLFVAARGFRFDSTAHPGDLLDLHVQLDSVVAGTAFASGEIRSRGRRLATVRSLVAARRPRTALPEPDARHRGDAR